MAGLGILGLPEWSLTALADGESLVPFTDMPENFPLTTGPDRRIIDIRKIDSPFTPKDQFFTTQHYGHPDVDAAAFRLKVTGLVDRSRSLSLDDLKRMRRVELVAGFECSGNRRPLQGLCGNARWTGVPLRDVLKQAGVKDSAREFVFFGADHGEEEVEFRTNKYKVDQQFGRSLPRERAMSPEPLLAYALNGEPLTKGQGFPLRLIVPGWYGVANVKWISQIHLQEEEYLGQVPGPMVPHAQGRDDRRRDEMEGKRRHAYAAQVVHRTRHANRQQLHGARRRVERWHSPQVG